MSRVLGFVGWPCAGKDKAAEYLQRAYDAKWYGHSSFIWALTRSSTHAVTTSDLSALFEARASHAGYGWIAQAVREQVRRLWESDPHRPVIVTGVRNVEEVEVYRDLPGFQLVNLEADRDLRFRRLQARRRPGEADLTWNQFVTIEALPGNRNVPDVLALADRVVENNGTPEDLYRALDALMSGA
ncbi:AAA family ATPase [Candidatus Uhrbacteria bacterium]|nr:AAA family ATPase [Candidatus Uhrbacteria bacterium]